MGGSGGRVVWSYCLTTRQGHSCDNRGTLINVHSGLMTNVIDSAIDDQNAVLTGILIELEWELITPDRKQLCSTRVCVCVCVFPRQRQYICVFQSNLSPVTVVRSSQVGLVTWMQSHERKQGSFSLVFLLCLWNSYLRGTLKTGNVETSVLCCLPWVCCKSAPPQGQHFLLINYSQLNW